MVFGRPAHMSIEVELGVPVRSPSSQSDYSCSVRKAIQHVNEIALRHLETARKQQCRQSGNPLNPGRSFGYGAQKGQIRH